MRKSSDKSTRKILKSLRDGTEWADYLIKTNRFFLPNNKSRSLDKLLEQIARNPMIDLTGKVLWRARKHEHGKEKRFAATQMGAPPRHLTRGGRISPSGIPCLYLADSIDTAIAETRPWNGSILSVAGFKIKKPLKLADVRFDICFSNIMQNVKDEGDEECRIEQLRFCAFLVSSFSKPAHDENAVDYVPSQFFSSRLKHEGYDGIVYESLMKADGYNLAIFNPKGAVEVDDFVKVYEIESVTYKKKVVMQDYYKRKSTKP